MTVESPPPARPRLRTGAPRSPSRRVALHATLCGPFIALFPVAWMLLSSLKPANRILSSEIKLFDQPDAGQLPHVLSDTDFTTWFLNSVVVAAFTMVLGISMSATAGYALSRFNFPGSRALMWVFLSPRCSPWRS